MAKVLSAWSKEAKKAMIDHDLSFNELADLCGYKREYISAIINGRVVSDDAKEKISQVLKIDNSLQSVS